MINIFCIRQHIYIALTAFFLSISNLHAFNLDDWRASWDNAQLHEREELIVDFFKYAFQPISSTRIETLNRLKNLQNIFKSSLWNHTDLIKQKALEKIINDEVILINAAIEMNLPEWCGTVPSKHLTGDNIAFLCSHQTFKINGYSSFFMPFDPEQVKPGDSVFVVTNYLDLFFDAYHTKIPHPYVLVTDNSDFPVPGKFAYLLEDEKILSWFCINPDNTQHTKLQFIPLGIRNHGYGKEPINFMDTILSSRRPSAKNILLYVNFTLNHQDRYDALTALQNKNWCTTVLNKKRQTDYYQDVFRSKFVLSPRGDGLDCWRTWETLLLGSFPIVKHSALDSLYEEFPIVIVNDWNEITEEFLEKKYLELSKSTYNFDMLFAKYWGERINSFLDKVTP